MRPDSQHDPPLQRRLRQVQAHPQALRPRAAALHRPDAQADGAQAGQRSQPQQARQGGHPAHSAQLHLTLQQRGGGGLHLWQQPLIQRAQSPRVGCSRGQSTEEAQHQQ